VRATVAERDTEARGVAESHVGTPLAGRLEEGQGQKVGRAHDVAAEVVSPLGDRFPVGNFSSDVRVLRGTRERGCRVSRSLHKGESAPRSPEG
jgi:hypothetical protein